MDISALVAAISGLLGAAIGGFATYKIQSRQLKHQEALLLYERGVDDLSMVGVLVQGISDAMQGCVNGAGGEREKEQFHLAVEKLRTFEIKEGHFLPRELRKKLAEYVAAADTLTQRLNDADFQFKISQKWHDSKNEIGDLIDKYLGPLHDFYDKISKGK